MRREGGSQCVGVSVWPRSTSKPSSRAHCPLTSPPTHPQPQPPTRSVRPLLALAKAAEDANEVAPITTVTSPIRQSYVTMGAYARVYKMSEVEAEDEDEVAYYGVDSAANGYRARHVFQDFKHVMGHIARSR